MPIVFQDTAPGGVSQIEKLAERKSRVHTIRGPVLKGTKAFGCTTGKDPESHRSGLKSAESSPQ